MGCFKCAPIQKYSYFSLESQGFRKKCLNFNLSHLIYNLEFLNDTFSKCKDRDIFSLIVPYISEVS